MSKEAEEYISDLVLSKYTESETIPNISQRFYSYNDMIEIFDAGVESVNKRIGDVNNYYQQLDSMSEEQQKGYIQAEKDMPKQFEALHDIIRLRKRIDELDAKNKWHDLVKNPNDIPNDNRYVLIKHIPDKQGGVCYRVASYFEEEKCFWSNDLDQGLGCIEAWKELE